MNGAWLSVSLNNTFINDYEVTWLEYTGRLSAPEFVQLKILSSLSLAEMNAALNTPITVVIQNIEQSWTLNLMLFRVNVLLGQELMGRNCYMLELYSPVYDLSRSHLTPVLKKMSLSGACELLLSGQFIKSRSTGLQSFRMNISNCDVNNPLPMMKGLNESLLSFWQRLLSVYGLSYAFDQNDSGMMVITDNLAGFAPGVAIMQNTYASGDLLTSVHYEQLQKVQRVSSADVLTAGHPRAAPETLLSSNSTSSVKGLSYQADFNEFNEDEAQLHATFLYQAQQGEVNRNYYTGGGILFPGQRAAVSGQKTEELVVSSHFTLEFDAHEQNRVRAIPLTVISQPLAYPYRDRPILLANHSMLFHGGTISDVTGDPSESVSVSSEGHYHILLPEFVTDNLSSMPVVDTRMVYPMQSDDHSQHFTLMNNSEGLLLYDATPLGESLLFGTGNSGAATHITNQDTAQNQYWQDASLNKQAFINEGTYDPTQKTGRATAQIMEAPNYHPDGSSSYMRMGDPIQNDSGYPAQAAESGTFMATTGHYQEEHQGGILHMAGNAGTDASNPIPVSRTMTQLNPVGTPNILQSSTANLHSDLMTTSTVSQTSELTAGTLTEVLTSPSLLNAWTADNTSGLFVNQDLEQMGDTTNLSLTSQNTTLTTPENNITQVGTQRTDQITTANVTQNHSNNLLQYQTLTKSTTTGQEQITTQNVNAPNLTRNTQTGTIQAGNFSTTTSNFSAAAQTIYLSSLNMSGAPASSSSDSLLQAHQATLAQQNQQQANLKKEIVFMVDDPDDLIQTPPQLSVNALNPMVLSSNSTTTYPLTSDQKEGAIALNLPTQSGSITSTLHEQIRRINMQQEAS